MTRRKETQEERLQVCDPLIFPDSREPNWKRKEEGEEGNGTEGGGGNRVDVPSPTIATVHDRRRTGTRTSMIVDPKKGGGRKKRLTVPSSQERFASVEGVFALPLLSSTLDL